MRPNINHTNLTGPEKCLIPSYLLQLGLEKEKENKSAKLLFIINLISLNEI